MLLYSLNMAGFDKLLECAFAYLVVGCCCSVVLFNNGWGGVLMTKRSIWSLSIPRHIVSIHFVLHGRRSTTSCTTSLTINVMTLILIHVFKMPFLDGDVPRRLSYGVYISQLIRFARVRSRVEDLNARNKCLTA